MFRCSDQIVYATGQHFSHFGLPGLLSMQMRVDYISILLKLNNFMVCLLLIDITKGELVWLTWLN